MELNNMVQHAAMTDVGRVRSLNEDNFVVLPERGFFLVADGMGGQAAGEVASEIAVQMIREFISQTDLSSDSTWPAEYDRKLSHGHNRLNAAFSKANGAILLEAGNDQTHKGMGTTAVAALLEKDQLQLAHVGDSRAYLLRGGHLRQLTRDHTWVNLQLENGFITEDEARTHPYRNIITRALGAAEHLDVEHADAELLPGDIVLLCSDGLSGMIDDHEIEALLKANAMDLEAASRTLVNRANENGGKDNITVVLFRYSG